MIDKNGIYSYRNILDLSKAAGKNVFKTLSFNGINQFQTATELFVKTYGDFFPSECRILRVYVERILNNRLLHSEDLNLLYYLVNIIDEDFDKKVKQPKIFISHSEKDILIVEKFVDLLSHIGLDNKYLFCSSIPGYNIKQGNGDIYDYIKNEFRNNLFVIFMLSKNYNSSKACLNEMGATWVLQKKYQSILLPGFDFSEVEGAINPREISFKLNDIKYRNSALGELKNNIVDFLGLQDIDPSKWDYQRERFFSHIDSIQI